MFRNHLALPTHLSVVCLAFLSSVLTSQHSFAQAENANAIWNRALERSPWVFLGDSNTYSGRYVAILDAWLDAAEISERPELLNLGVSSETAAGTSEVDHPFKRPCVHERLDRALAMTRPGVVFICYGMNDGIYEPFNADVFKAYQAGMQGLADQVRESGAILVVLTPPPFEQDALEVNNRPFGPNQKGRYAYNAPYRDYDEVQERMAVFCMKDSLGADLVINLRSALTQEKARRRQAEPEFVFSRDGVHFNNEAHGLVAETLLRDLGAPQAVLDSFPSDAQVSSRYKNMKLMRDAYLSAIGKNRPNLPAGLPVWYARQQVNDQP